MLKVENISKAYNTVLAVDNLSFEVNDGEIFGLLGINGAGKTTTFRMIIGLLDMDSGKITLDGQKIDYNITDKIGFLTEERSLLTKLTIKQQAMLYGKLKSMNEKDILQKLDYWLERFSISEYKNRKIKELSKGNQQKVQFIVSIIHEPKLLILDEPFTGLDPINVKLFMEVIEELKQKGCSIIFSSHQLEHVELFCEKLVILVKGKTVLKGNLKEIKHDYQKKNILVKGKIKEKEIENLPGVLSIKKVNDEYLIKIKEEKYIKDVFKVVKQSDDITKFLVEDASLNEIFLDKVGEAYEK